MTQKTFLVLFCTLLFACGGGSEDQIPAKVEPIIVTASISVSEVDEESTFTVTAAASGGDNSFTFDWEVPDSFTFSERDTTTGRSVIIAPTLITQTTFSLAVNVTDSQGRTGRDTLQLTVNPVNALPTASISATQIQDYPTNHYPVQAQFVLDGSASNDADPIEGLPAIKRFRWQQLSGTLLIGGLDLSGETLTLSTPITDNQETLQFRLEVTDQEGATSAANINVTLVGQSGTLPNIEVRNSQRFISGEKIALFASVSSQAPNAYPILISWSSTDPELQSSLSSSGQDSTVAIAPQVASTSTFTLDAQAQDQFGNVVINSVDITVQPQPNATINDTGIELFSDASTLSSELDVNFAGQDAEFGNDPISENNTGDKIGEGEAGFDFTRLDENGDPIITENQTFMCVRDNVTGLVWEVKQDDPASLHHQNHLYTWFQEEDNGNDSGVVNSGSTSCANPSSECNTSAFVDAVNAQGLCGFFDWRLANHQELQSLVHFGKLSSPLADTQAFPFWGANGSNTLWYWTDQSGADGVSNDTAQNAWAIDFATGNDNFIRKNSELRVILVRAGRQPIN